MILNVLVIESRRGCGRVWCDSFSGSLGVLCLYLWYNHTISFSNVCVRGTSLCVLCVFLLY